MPTKIFHGPIQDTDIISVQTPNNPKRPGTRAFWKYELLCKFDNQMVRDYKSAVKALRSNPSCQLAVNLGFSPADAKVAASEGAGAGELRWCLEGSRLFIKLK